MKESSKIHKINIVFREQSDIYGIRISNYNFSRKFIQGGENEPTKEQNLKITGIAYRELTIQDFEFIDCEFVDCEFIDVLITDSIFRNCKFTNCHFHNSEFGLVSFENVKFDRCTIFRVYIFTGSQAKISFTYCTSISEIQISCENNSTYVFNKCTIYDGEIRGTIKKANATFLINESKISDLLFMNIQFEDSMIKKSALDNLSFINCKIAEKNFSEFYTNPIEGSSNIDLKTVNNSEGQIGKLLKFLFAHKEIGSTFNNYEEEKILPIERTNEIRKEYLELIKEGRIEEAIDKLFTEKFIENKTKLHDELTILAFRLNKLKEYQRQGTIQPENFHASLIQVTNSLLELITIFFKKKNSR